MPLIPADTKYELGLLGEEIVLIDELHTPDSSRLLVRRHLRRALQKEQGPAGTRQGATARVDGRARIPRRRRGPHHDNLLPPERGGVAVLVARAMVIGDRIDLASY
jgi:hypothetical protein